MSKKLVLSVSVLILATLACNFVAPTPQPAIPPTHSAPTVIVEPTSSPRLDLPRDEAGVPRVSVEQAKAALDSGAAIIVDVRPEQSYALEHIAGSISIPLAEIETDPTSLKLDKKQWIITYCT